MEPFTFAGFTFPRRIAMLPKNKPAARLTNLRKSPAPFKVAARQMLSSYTHAPTPNAPGAFFYLDSDFAPGMRWTWADETEARINHTGWWTDPDGIGDSIRGLVVRLPKGRGFLAGWSMGEGMASNLDTSRRYDDETGAAHAADSMAEHAAEEEREYQTAAQAGMKWAELGEEVADARRSLLAILRDRKSASVSATLCGVIREKVESLLEDIREARSKRDELADGDADGLMFWTGEARLAAAFNENAGVQVIRAS